MEEVGVKKASCSVQRRGSRHNPGVIVSFTGHSLGGGLAALMGVMFDEQAVTFDQAPFANLASTAIRDDLVNYLHGQGYSGGQLQALALELLSYSGGGDRVANVSGYFVQGEALQYLPFSTLGLQVILNQSSTGLGLLGSIDLHSQALLSAFLQNDAFRQITFKLSELLKMTFDSALYYNDPGNTVNPQRNFFDPPIRHQAMNAAADVKRASCWAGQAPTASPAATRLTC